MKTLDEVIEAIGFCKSGDLSKCKDCPYIGTCELDYAVLSDDALHYLREYRERHEEILRTEEALGYCEMAENRPLTWDELKTMEGNPVWVEALLYKQWAIIAYVGVDHIRFEGANLYAPECRVYMGADNGWQAYRKERE